MTRILTNEEVLDVARRIKALILKHPIESERTLMLDEFSRIQKVEEILTAKRFELSDNFYSFDAFIRYVVYDLYVHYYAVRFEGANQDAAKALLRAVSMWAADPASKMLTISPELWEDLENTKAPDDTTYGELEQPYKSYCLAVPRGLLEFRPGEFVSFVFVQTQKQGTPYSVPKDLFNLSKPVVDTAVGSLLEFNQLILAIGTASNSCSIHIIQPRDDAPLAELMEHSLDKAENRNKEAVLHTDMYRTMLGRIQSMICHLCLYLSSKPDDVQEPEHLKNVKRASFITQDQLPKSALWYPTRIGEAYARSVNLDSIHKEGRSPRMHQRRKHWKRKVHGEGRKLRTWIQIPWTMVNAPKDKKNE